MESAGRSIEVKACGRWLGHSGVLYFTPPQIRRATEDPRYFVYIVEDVAQADSAKFELRVLGGELLRELVAQAKPHRVSVSLRRADYAKLRRLDE